MPAMTNIRRVLPADLVVGDCIYLKPLHLFATRELSREEYMDSGVGPVEVIGFGEFDRSAGTILVRTALFDARVPVDHRVAVVES